ncbi:MAG: TrkA family potassium uptake protein [Pirellulaceae bacterium]|nr:TrkA family potassium uptake protein [Pirellulaceae bacterium]
MKRFIIIGLGNFGSTLARSLTDNGHEVVAIDIDGEVVDQVAPHVARAVVGDATVLETLERLGVREADAGIVSTGEDIASSILAVMALNDLKVRDVFVKVISVDHARVMNRIGVTEVIFPERDSALELAKRMGGDALLKYVSLGIGFGLQEMGVPDAWCGKSIRELALRQGYDVTIVAVHDMLKDRITASPNPDTRLLDSDTLLLAGTDEALARIAKVK